MYVERLFLCFVSAPTFVEMKRMEICLSICLSVYLSICLSICLKGTIEDDDGEDGDMKKG